MNIDANSIIHTDRVGSNSSNLHSSVDVVQHHSPSLAYISVMFWGSRVPGFRVTHMQAKLRSLPRKYKISILVTETKIIFQYCLHCQLFIPSSLHILATSFLVFSSLSLRDFLYNIFRLQGKTFKTKWKINELLPNIFVTCCQKPSYQNWMNTTKQI